MKSIHQLRNGELFALTIFLSVANHRSFRAAALELNVTPSAVSHAIKSLEERLSVRLFHRTTRSVALTAAGNQLADSLRPALANVSNALKSLDDFNDTPRGTLRINTSEGAAHLVLKPILARFLQQYPQVDLDIVCDGKLSDIVKDGFDAGIRLADDVPQDMIAISLTGPIQFLAVASPDYLAQHGTPCLPQDLYGHRCIRFRFESGAIFRWEFNQDDVIHRIDVTGPLTLTNHPLMVDAAIDGIGIAYVPDHLVQAALSNGQLKQILASYSPSYAGLSLYYSGHRHVSPALRALITMLRQRTA